VSHKKPELPVVEVDQAFPLLTTEGAARGGRQSTGATDQTPAVTEVIRDVLGWRPRRQDTKAFTAALDASFQLKTVEGHIESRYVPRGYAIQADLGGVTGGQASLYTRAKTSHVEITRILDALKPLRPDADPEDCEAYRVLVRDSVRQVVSELGVPGGPRVELVDSAFSVLTGQQFGPAQGFSSGAIPQTKRSLVPVNVNRFGRVPVALAPPGETADDIPGQLGALRERFGLTDDNVNTVDEEKIRTAFVTLVDLVVDLQRSWSQQRLAFSSDIGRGFLGTELVLINRLMAASAEQVDELEAVLESALVSSAERQTIELDTRTRLTLDGLLGWVRSFLTEDGPRIARDTGRDGLTTSFTPTVLAILQAFRCTLVARLVPCGSARCGGLGICRCGRRGLVSYIPLGCCSPLPPGMYAGRTRIAVSGLCGLLERLGRAAARIGRFSGAVLLDVVVTPFDDIRLTGQQPILDNSGFVRVEVRGLHLRPNYLPAFVTGGGAGRQTEELVLPIRGSASANADSVVGVFARGSLPEPLVNLALDDGAVVAAAEVPLALVDGETGRIVLAPTVTTWPDLRPAAAPSGNSGPNDDWDQQPEDQRWAPQSTTSSLPTDEDYVDTDDCTEPCRQQCDQRCGAECDCDCGCHLETKISAAMQGAAMYVNNQTVQAAALDLWGAVKEARLVDDDTRDRVENAADEVGRFVERAREHEVPAKLGTLVQALQDVRPTAPAEQPAARRRLTPPLDPDRRADAAAARIERARAELAAADDNARQMAGLAEQDARSAEEAMRTAREAEEQATALGGRPPPPYPHPPPCRQAARGGQAATDRGRARIQNRRARDADRGAGHERGRADALAGRRGGHRQRVSGQGQAKGQEEPPRQADQEQVVQREERVENDAL
jgi:hypothetical protein